MILLKIRELFNEMQLCSLFIMPLFIPWIIINVILKIKKYNKNMFCYRFHKKTGLILLIAFFVPIVGCISANFCFGEQKTFRSYQYFIGTEPARNCLFAEVPPEGNINIKYYCYYAPMQIGKTVGVNYKFEQENLAQVFLAERLYVWDKEYSEREYITYLFDEEGLSLDEIDEERLRKYLAELSSFSLEECEVLLYFEDVHSREQRWILYNRNQQEVIEIVSDYASW
ncbi:MAG: hypothetical protein J6A80_06435 [Lachnospiraceae bacterium]|nr:hypothetical protein [Lachnospiraceae bacterium]